MQACLQEAFAAGDEKVLLRAANFMALSIATVLQDDCLLGRVFGFLPPRGLLACSEACAHFYGLIEDSEALGASLDVAQENVRDRASEPSESGN